MSEQKKKGMLFGKINVIDLVIILAVVLIAVFLVLKFSDGGSTVVGQAAPNDHVRITFYQEECADFIVAQTKVGDSVYDGNNGNYIGKVSEVVTDAESKTYVTDEDGNMHIAPKEGYCAVYISVDVLGTMTDRGVVVESFNYGVGHTLVLHAGLGKYYLRVYDIQPIE